MTKQKPKKSATKKVTPKAKSKAAGGSANDPVGPGGSANDPVGPGR